jgi:hypothetical protein
LWFGKEHFTNDYTLVDPPQQTMAGKKTGVKPEVSTASVDSSDGSEAVTVEAVAVEGHCTGDDGIYDFTRVEIFAALPRS